MLFLVILLQKHDSLKLNLDLNLKLFYCWPYNLPHDFKLQREQKPIQAAGPAVCTAGYRQCCNKVIKVVASQKTKNWLPTAGLGTTILTLCTYGLDRATMTANRIRKLLHNFFRAEMPCICIQTPFILLSAALICQVNPHADDHILFVSSEGSWKPPWCA